MPTDDFEAARQSSKSWYWWGIPTFFRCNWNEDPSAADIALVGVPHSSGNGSTERDQHLGPRAVRHVSGFYRRSHAIHGFAPWDVARINDLGDVPLPEAMNNEACVRDIEAYYKRFDRTGTRPVSIGGDHSITGPIIKALAGPNSRMTGGQPCALIHLDAHTDSYDNMPHWLGAKRSAAHWAAYTAHELAVDPGHSVQIGMRGHPAGAIHAGGVGGSSRALGYQVITMAEFEAIGIEKTLSMIRDRVGDRPAYVTFDLDCLDPSVAPGVSNLEPGFGGFSIREATRLLQGLKGLDIIGADVVCLMPTKDSPNQITAQVAMVMMFELICLIAHRYNKPSA
ncbi:MAG: arginase family protein [Alphaproteobacteria bacterium]|nr:arginase family protein [Alphaproteobacteria bacterium]